MELSGAKMRFLLVLPLLLLLSTALVFVSLSGWLGDELGYLLGFIFYWLVWCIGVPFLYLGKQGVRSLFRDRTPLFSRANWTASALFVLVFIIAFSMYWQEFIEAPIILILITVPTAIINGICEEMLWRGLYTRLFPERLFGGVIYPSLGFALWHLSPQLIFPVDNGVILFIVSTCFLGLAYGWIAFKTGSVKWSALSHSMSGILALGGYIAPMIYHRISA